MNSLDPPEKGSLKRTVLSPSYPKNSRLCVARVLVPVAAIKNHIEIGKRKGGCSCLQHGSTSYNRTVHLTTFGTSSDCTSVLSCKQHLEKSQRTRKLGDLNLNPLLNRMPLACVWNPCHQLVVIQSAGLVSQFQLVHTTIKLNDFSEVGKRLLKPIRWRKMIFLGCCARWWLWIKTPSQNLLWVALQRTRGPILRPQIHWAVAP
jgi:hypothetical protein